MSQSVLIFLDGCFLESFLGSSVSSSFKMVLELELREYFGEEKKRVVLIGVGNPMRGDDGVGVKIIELLNDKGMPDVLLLNTETVPEAFAGKVSEFMPTHILILDAANFHGKPGEVRLITTEQIGGQAISTHSLPLNIFISYVKNEVGVESMLLGIQPKRIEFFTEMTDEVREAAEKVAETLYYILK
jgi:hydrogenase 3 maturation protease